MTGKDDRPRKYMPLSSVHHESNILSIRWIILERYNIISRNKYQIYGAMTV